MIPTKSQNAALTSDALAYLAERAQARQDRVAARLTFRKWHPRIIRVTNLRTGEIEI